MIEIQSMRLMSGDLSPRVFGLVMEWGLLHRKELQAAWESAQRHLPLPNILPLE